MLMHGKNRANSDLNVYVNMSINVDVNKSINQHFLIS